jgi:hypothetical protein
VSACALALPCSAEQHRVELHHLSSVACVARNGHPASSARTCRGRAARSIGSMECMSILRHGFICASNRVDSGRGSLTIGRTCVSSLPCYALQPHLTSAPFTCMCWHNCEPHVDTHALPCTPTTTHCHVHACAGVTVSHTLTHIHCRALQPHRTAVPRHVQA